MESDWLITSSGKEHKGVDGNKDQEKIFSVDMEEDIGSEEEKHYTGAKLEIVE